MFNKKIFLIFFCLLINGCSNFEFIYNSSLINTMKKIKEQTNVSISGDDADIISGYVLNKINESSQDAEFHLIIDSVKNITAAVMEKDATASKINIEYDIIYELRNIGEKCLIIRQTIKSKATFDSKSAGYSFGSDLSEKETSVKTLHSNIDEFFNAIKYSKINFSCKNEN